MSKKQLTLIEANKRVVAEVISRPRKVGRKIRTMKAGNARDAIGELTAGVDLYCLTFGQFSLIDLLCVVLEQTGPADVDVATWIAAQADMDVVKELLGRAAIEQFRLVVDRSFVRMKPAHCRDIEKMFGEGCIRSCNTHAKFIRIKNAKWNIAIRTSMNLNQNPRLENFELTDCPELCGFLGTVVDSIFKEHKPGDWDAGTTNLTSVPNSKRNGGVQMGEISKSDTPAETKLRPDGEFKW